MTSRSYPRRSISFVITAVAALGCLTPERARAQALETETARLLDPGQVEADAGFEYQTSSEGTEWAVPFAFELGLLPRLELLVEPVAQASVSPKQGRSATGPGDLELTVTGLVLEEDGWWPALAVAGEVKFPTANDALIGTGEYDYTGYLIASERFGDLDTHFNVGYSVLGSPPGVHAGNIFDFAVAAEYHVADRVEVFGELLANTSSGAEGGDQTPIGAEPGPASASPELAGGEVVGTLGAGWWAAPWMHLYLGGSFDNNQAFLVHPGISLKLEGW